jgi:hypothetical protein
MSSDVDALFKLPLGEFTAARNALAARLKKAGRQDEANDVKALAKPSVAAWVVNQLYWRHRESFDRLIEAGDRLRGAQASQLKSDSGRAPAVARREAVTALAQIAAKILGEGDHGATRDLLRRVSSTLEALSLYGSLPDAPVAGRLTADLEPPGFGAVAGLFSASGQLRAVDSRPNAKPTAKAVRQTPQGGTGRRDEQGQRELVAAAKLSVREAERALSAARKHADRAAAKSEAAANRATLTEGERARIEKQMVEAAREADAARQDASDAAASVNEATQATEAAERGLELARRRLRQITGDEA